VQPGWTGAPHVIPSAWEFCDTLKTFASSVAKGRQKWFRYAALIIIVTHVLATVLATIGLMSHPSHAPAQSPAGGDTNGSITSPLIPAVLATNVVGSRSENLFTAVVVTRAAAAFPAPVAKTANVDEPTHADGRPQSAWLGCWGGCCAESFSCLSGA
jgi:hypothetical protein